jgi:hypothetical protein
MAGIVSDITSDQLSQALASGNDYRAATSAQMAAKIVQAAPTDVFIQLYSNFYKPVGEIADYISVTAEFPRNAVETATVVLKHTDAMANIAMQCTKTVVPITIQIGNMRWSGRVDTFDYAFENGEYKVTIQCIGDYNWFNKILVWPDFLLPLQVQFPSRALFIGPAITCIKTMIAEQCFRLQSGLWELVNNLGSLNLDFRSWFGTILESDGNVIDMLMTPIVVLPTDPIFDTSPWVSFNGRMDKISTLVEQVVKDNGLVLTANLWLPGDPQPVGLLIPLKLPTIVVDCKNRSGVTGPTGLFIDGLITDVVDLQGSVLGETLAPFLNPSHQYAPEGVNIAPLLGVDFVKPWVIFQDHPRGGLTSFHLNGHHPQAFTVIGGGKSPKWMNDLINATLEFLIDSISIAIGISGIPSDLFDGTFDDIILAFQQIENYDRRVALGPYGYPEVFVKTGSTAYTLDEWFALMGAMWDSRGYHSVQLEFEDGYPYKLGKDIFVGALASFAMLGKLYTDYVEKVTYTDDRKTRAKAVVVIGDGKAKEAPISRILRKITSFEEAFNIATLSSH